MENKSAMETLPAQVTAAESLERNRKLCESADPEVQAAPAPAPLPMSPTDLPKQVSVRELAAACKEKI